MRPRFWWLFASIEMAALGVNILSYQHHPQEILQFLGGQLITTGVIITLYITLFQRVKD